MRGALRTRRCFDRDTGISAHGALQSPVDLRTRRREVPNLHDDRDVTITQEGTGGDTLLWRGFPDQLAIALGPRMVTILSITLRLGESDYRGIRRICKQSATFFARNRDPVFFNIG